jgi:hypothetical protein
MNRITGIIGAALLGLGTLALSGCGQAAEEAVEQGIEQGTGADVEIDDDGVRVTDEEGNEFSAGEAAELPSTWPSQVPTPEGTLVFAGATGEDATGDVAQGVWQSEANVADAAQQYGAALTSAGFTLDTTMSMDEATAKIANYAGNGYQVGVIVAEGEGGSGASVSVTVNTQG